MNLGEIIGRTRQGAYMFAERAGVATHTKLLTDAELFGNLDSWESRVSPALLLEYFRERTTPQFYASVSDSQETVAALRKHFPESEPHIISLANNIIDGRFDLLGYKNLYFQNPVPDWHFDPISQKTSPREHWSKIEEVSAERTGDKKVIWELNRHQYFNTLGRAYWLTNDEKYAATWAAHIKDWTADNPPKIGVNWLSSLEISFRSISWIWALYFFKNSPHFTPEILVQMLKYFYLNGRHIETYLSTYFSPNTHLTGEALGLYFLGTFLPEFKEAKRWKNLGYKILMDALDFQVRPDGTYCEQSSHYHRYTTDFYANLMIVRELEGADIEAKHRQNLDKLLDFLMYIAQPNGETPLFGDDDGGRFYFFDDRELTDFRPTLAVGATLLNRGDLKFAAKAPSQELLWLLGAAGIRKFNSIPAVEPDRRSGAFKDGGFFTCRSGWNSKADFIFIECGPHGFLNGGHAHADALNFVLSVDGQPIFIDSGTYGYTADLASRRLFRSGVSHNCLSVNSESSSVPGGAFTWKTTADAKLIEWLENDETVHFRGLHNGFERFGVEYEREIEFGKNPLVTLTDIVKSSGPNDFELNFILSPGTDAQVQADSLNVLILNESRPLLNINTETADGSVERSGEWTIENCEVSSCYGWKVKSKKLIFSTRMHGNFQILNRFSKLIP